MMNKKLVTCLCFSVLLLLGIVSFQPVNAEITFSLKFGTADSSNTGLLKPYSVLVSKDGNSIYAIDTGNNRINVFEKNGNPDFKFGSICDTDLLTDCNADALGADNRGDGQFNNLKGAALDSRHGTLFVVDTDNNRIQIFNENGKFESVFGSSGSGNGKFNLPSGVTIDEDNRLLYVADTDNDRIQVFKLVDSTTCPSGTSKTADEVFKLVDSTTCPSGTSKTADGVCFVKSFGSSGSSDGKFNSPIGLALNSSNDLLYVADTDNDRIQVFKLVDSTTCPSGTSKTADGVWSKWD